MVLVRCLGLDLKPIVKYLELSKRQRVQRLKLIEIEIKSMFEEIS
ncbi:MAG: hypothetical protein PWQ58_473 [Archaeoglobaceae archaeon]|nr:hypothetical protein [Archaeoglobaceae archaeon]